MISMSFYWSLMVSQFFDVKRKDFWQMFIHHIATIVLMALSWMVNLHRIGSLVLVVHDCADILLEVIRKIAADNLRCALTVLFVVVFRLQRRRSTPVIKNCATQFLPFLQCSGSSPVLASIRSGSSESEYEIYRVVQN